VVIGLAGMGAGSLTHEGARGLVFGVEIGLVVAAVGGIVTIVSPYIEWWADTLPPQRLGLFGAILLLVGFALQSLQYWATLLNVEVR
jgi:drug/metabolite transporter superfamily protein YnfA